MFLLPYLQCLVYACEIYITSMCITTHTNLHVLVSSHKLCLVSCVQRSGVEVCTEFQHEMTFESTETAFCINFTFNDKPQPERRETLYAKRNFSNQTEKFLLVCLYLQRFYLTIDFLLSCKYGLQVKYYLFFSVCYSQFPVTYFNFIELSDQM